MVKIILIIVTQKNYLYTISEAKNNELPSANTY